jgi:hypothetical protein
VRDRFERSQRRMNVKRNPFIMLRFTLHGVHRADSGAQTAFQSID